MSICVMTGGAGFIGCALSAGLAERFDRVIAIDMLLPQVHARAERPAALHPSVEFLHGDIKSATLWDELLASTRPDVVIHLAAETGTGQSLRESTRHAQENVVGTTAMLDAFSRHGVRPRQILLSSSRAVYGEGAWVRETGEQFYPGGRTAEQLERGEWDFPSSEHLPFAVDTTRPTPANIYAATKLAQEHILEPWADAFGCNATILRLQNVYGPGQSLTNSYTGIVSLFARLARDGKTIPLYEDGNMLRDFVYIDDVASAFLASIDNEYYGVNRFDIGSGAPCTIKDAARILAELYGAPDPVVSGQFRLGDVRHASCNLEKTLQGLNWKPRFTLKNGLQNLCSWIDEQIPEVSAPFT